MTTNFYVATLCFPENVLGAQSTLSNLVTFSIPLKQNVWSPIVCPEIYTPKISVTPFVNFAVCTTLLCEEIKQFPTLTEFERSLHCDRDGFDCSFLKGGSTMFMVYLPLSVPW